ncbi:monovalent cation/H+ antiporter subunit A [Herminiimonas fonticola]|uniref:Multisubunit potassium/proton antiporter PhaA subunit /multisubunit potassium/proton antiporter PhaB subunit n=1 Tax=Herminiimonas fonticola TaxID=303380 RepID=A0A4R6GGN8_9BURK|nr:monovalent cation/H+ antiporter subunit A [Herminiimonas fonticola]RBA24929.1 NADH-Ubiquinone/plastoquinone (complex I), various chain [Herminiimonas fonticola]TDN94043.1 multisubunit potassium/proton antiporter PhaA subunit /multisubunit potassium/proton antiporter PhaB subunit [Herminiimonas fonticola]
MYRIPEAILLLAIVIAPFIGSVIAACMPANARNRVSILAAGISLFGLLGSAYLYQQVGAGEIVRYQAAWMPAFGVEFMLRMDGLAWLFSMLVLGVGLLVVLYARYYMSPKDPVPRFFSFLLAFMGSMLGVVLSGNLIQLVVFWELTSITSFLLIGYWHHRIDARRGARMAFTVTGAGGLCLLCGVLIIGHIVGSYDLDTVLEAGDLIRAHDLYLPALILVALGALTKSAQFPFHFWLPHAMAAPTPVSSYLHSATMVKAGVFLLMRFWPALSGTEEWMWIIAGAGVCTLLLGSFVAIFQHDLKGLLAYSTISHLGLITVLLGIGSPLGMVAAIFHTVNHAIFKASLFMAAGIIDHETGTRDMRILRGLRHALPITATLAIVASAAMAGVPLLNGFLSKEMFFAETALVGGTESWWMSYAALAMGIFSVTYSLRFISVFFGKLSADLPKTAHEPPRWMRFPVECLVLLCLIVGVAPALSIKPFLDSAVLSVLGERAPVYDLAMWHGFNLPLAMSFAALAGGVLLYVILRKYFTLQSRDRVPVFHGLSGAQAYESTMLRLASGSAFLVKWLGTRRLQPQLFLIIVAMIAVPLLLVRPLPTLAAASLADIDPLFAMMWLIGCACAVAAAWQAKYHRLAALILISGTGAVVSMTFLWLSAPDLALTQLMVETVTTVLILLGLRWLPRRLVPRELNMQIPRTVWLRRSRDMALAIVGGLSIAAVSYIVLMHPQPASIGDFFLLRALSEGGGTNVVNVLLVDFRGFDTMGEITVLAIVALTVYALLRRFRPTPESIALPEQQLNNTDPAAQQTPAEQVDSGYLMIPGVYLRFLLPFMAMIVMYFFMRGHNLPGGGFVAGLIFAVAIIVQYMLAGTTWLESHLHLRPLRWLSFGLIIACATGLGAIVLGYPFLTSHTAHVNFPVLGEIHIPSAFFFDLGVFVVVVGATMLILVALAHQSIRSRRPQAGNASEASTASNKRGVI